MTSFSFGGATQTISDFGFGSPHASYSTTVSESVTKVTNCKIEWKIKDFFSLRRSPLFSQSFTFCNMSCRIQMLPHSTKKSNDIPIFLEIMSSITGAHSVVTTFGIKKSDGSEFDCIHEILNFKKNVLSIQAGFIDKTPLLESRSIWVPGGNLTILCNLSHESGDLPEIASPTTYHNSSTLHTTILVKDLEDLFLTKRDNDVVLNVQGVEFKAHRLILIARSPVFATMFQHDMTESQRGAVDIDDCDPVSFQDFLLYLYTGKTDHVTSDKAPGLYITADKYSVLELKRKCAKCMELSLSIDSVCDALVLASAHSETELLESAKNFFIKNMKEVVQTQNWNDFQSQNFTLVKELFLKSADYIII